MRRSRCFPPLRLASALRRPPAMPATRASVRLFARASHASQTRPCLSPSPNLPLAKQRRSPLARALGRLEAGQTAGPTHERPAVAAAVAVPKTPRQAQTVALESVWWDFGLLSLLCGKDIVCLPASANAPGSLGPLPTLSTASTGVSSAGVCNRVRLRASMWKCRTRNVTLHPLVRIAIARCRLVR